jgi:penicillin-binding protein 2
MLVFDQLKKNDVQLQLLALVFCVGLVALVVGLWWVQIVNVSQHQESVETQAFRSVRIPAVRGKILDRNGVALVENRPNYNINLYLEELSPAFRKEYQRIRPRVVVTNDLPFWKDWLGFPTVTTQYTKLSIDDLMLVQRQARYNAAASVVRRISDVLQSPLTLDYTNFTRHYDLQRALPYTVVSNISMAQVARFEERGINSLGVDLEAQPIRTYPFGLMAAHTLGYVRSDDRSAPNELAYFSYRKPDYRGIVGIEGGYDPQLRGVAGAKSVQVNSLGYRQSETIWEAAESGRNVVLTLDVRIQKAAENSIRKFLGPNARAAVVVVHVETGDVLAMASSPTFDPNAFIRKFSPDEWARWNSEELGVQKNRATFEHYQAGSIFKTIVALAALEKGLNPREEFIVEPNRHNPNKGVFHLGRDAIGDTAPPGRYDLERAIVRSSNSYFITNGLRPGVFDKIVELGARLHLGERMGLLVSQETPGHFPRAGDQRNWNPRFKANICIGQGEMDVTPMQMAVMTCALANGGKVLKPRLVDRLETQDLAGIEPPEVFPKGVVRDHLGVSQRNLDIVRNAMLAETEDVADNATGRYVRVEGLRICGKTGTAERRERRADGQFKNTVWFVSYAPYERPQWAVVVMVEDGQSGGGTCAPIARDVYLALQQMNRPATNTLATR